MLLAQTHEGADNEYAHVYGAFAMENVRRHQCAVFGESPGAIPPSASGTGPNLQPVIRILIIFNGFLI